MGYPRLPVWSDMKNAIRILEGQGQVPVQGPGDRSLESSQLSVYAARLSTLQVTVPLNPDPLSVNKLRWG